MMMHASWRAHVETLCEEVERQAKRLRVAMGWSEKDAYYGAIDNVVDDATYHVPALEYSNYERMELYWAIVAKLGFRGTAFESKAE